MAEPSPLERIKVWNVVQQNADASLMTIHALYTPEWDTNGMTVAPMRTTKSRIISNVIKPTEPTTWTVILPLSSKTLLPRPWKLSFIRQSMISLRRMVHLNASVMSINQLILNTIGILYPFLLNRNQAKVIWYLAHIHIYLWWCILPRR